MFKYAIDYSVGKSGRLDADERTGEAFEFIKEEGYTRYGFYWWFWLPSFSSNDGRFSQEDHCIHFDIHWLCFWATLYFWRKPYNRNSGVKKSPEVMQQPDVREKS